jgi:hypothetical protein
MSKHETSALLSGDTTRSLGALLLFGWSLGVLTATIWSDWLRAENEVEAFWARHKVDVQ